MDPKQPRPSLTLQLRVGVADRATLLELLEAETARLPVLSWDPPLRPDRADPDILVSESGGIEVDASELRSLRIHGARWPEDQVPLPVDAVHPGFVVLWRTCLSELMAVPGVAELPPLPQLSVLHAVWLGKALERRLEMRRRLMSELVRRFPDVFAGTADRSDPVPATELADASSLHPGVVQDIARGVTLGCALGVVPLARFVTFDWEPAPE